jgi:hypothetical protein
MYVLWVTTGTAPRGKEDDPEFEAQSKIFQLYAGGWGAWYSRRVCTSHGIYHGMQRCSDCITGDAVCLKCNSAGVQGNAIVRSELLCAVD